MSPCDSGRLVGVCLQGLEIRCVTLPHVSFPRKESSDCVALISGSFNAPFYGRSGCDLFDIVQTSVGEEWLASHSRVSVRGVVLINPKFSPDWPQCSLPTDLIDFCTDSPVRSRSTHKIKMCWSRHHVLTCALGSPERQNLKCDRNPHRVLCLRRSQGEASQ